MLHFCKTWSLVHISFMRMVLQPRKPGHGVDPLVVILLQTSKLHLGILVYMWKTGEIVEILTWSCVDIYCLKEKRWKGASATLVKGKDTVFKIFWISSGIGSGRIGIAAHQKWIESVLEVNCVSDRITVLKWDFEVNLFYDKLLIAKLCFLHMWWLQWIYWNNSNWMVKDVQVVPSKECVAEHIFLNSSTVINFPKKAKKVFTP